MSIEARYNPKFLRAEVPQGQEAMDSEVFAMVKHNPTRRVDADTLPPIVLDDDGMHFEEPRPSAGRLLAGATAFLALCVGGISGLVGTVFAICTAAIPASVGSVTFISLASACVLSGISREGRSR